MPNDLVRATDVTAAVERVVEMARRVPASAEQWDRRAGQLRWTSRKTLAHMADAVLWYAGNLAFRSTHSAETQDIDPRLRVPRLLDALEVAGALLVAAVTTARPPDRGWHSYGIADRSGFAAMGCDEILVHGYDLSCGLGAGGSITLTPPPDLARRVTRRLFPWAPTDHDPWQTLLWANGRVALGDRPPERRWLWHCAPLETWDGRTRRMRERTER